MHPCFILLVIQAHPHLHPLRIVLITIIPTSDRIVELPSYPALALSTSRQTLRNEFSMTWGMAEFKLERHRVVLLSTLSRRQ